MSKQPRKIGRAANKPAHRVIPRVATNAQLQIPRSEAYGCGIASIVYDLSQGLDEFGLANMQFMVEMLANGDKQAVIDMLEIWKRRRYGNKFSMIDEALGIRSAYGLTAATASKNGIC